MPCACQIPGPAYPENKEWGPFLWTVLHALAERVGSTVASLYEADEKRAWIQLLQTTGSILPCDLCRDHYKSWLAANPVTSITNLAGPALKDFIKRWLWSLHGSVNSRLSKPSVAFEELTDLYSHANIQLQFKTFELIQKRAIQQGGVPLQTWMNWVKFYRTLTSVYGIT
jgi:Erv1 / Alr family